jgi:hypothetical protein
VQPDPPEPLGPELHEAETALDTTLAEACETKPATKSASEADTNELIQVEELIEQAGDAVKRAISLRRKRRVDREEREKARATMSDVEGEVSGDATHRILRDARGMRWDVFAVYPEARVSVHSQLRGDYSQGWLCFDSASEKRRLSPIPDQWERLTNDQLAELAERAEKAPSRSMRSRDRSDPQEPRRTE